MNTRIARVLAASLLLFSSTAALGQEKSINPGINDAFRDPNVQDFTARFETESREVFAKRAEIVAACNVQPGQTVADIGAGTGLFTQLFADAVTQRGTVVAVDIADEFLEHIQKAARELGHQNVRTVLATADSTGLPPESIDVAFICDTYHHFEFPQKTMTSLRRALKPGGRVVLIDFRRVPGESSEFVMGHVRAGQQVFEDEIARAGFRKVREEKDILKENYFVVFEKSDSPDERKTSAVQRMFPLVERYGGVVVRPDAVEQPRAGTKVVFDATTGGPPEEHNKAVERVARLLNLYGAAGLQASDVQIALVLHGDATAVALSDAAYRQRYNVERNPNLDLIRELKKLGVEVSVCGQAVTNHGFDDSEISDVVPIAASALTAVMNKQADGYGYVPVP